MIPSLVFGGLGGLVAATFAAIHMSVGTFEPGDAPVFAAVPAPARVVRDGAPAAITDATSADEAWPSRELVSA